MLSTDMSKAFDSISHSLTLKNLEAYGFTSASLSLMRSYFKNRMNRVKLGDTRSEWKAMTRGCPQGSSFGPLLWNLFQNDMAYNINSEANLLLYADDHQMYTTGPDFSKVRDALEKEGKQAYAWYKDNYLLANKDKFQTMVMNPRNVETNSARLYVIIEDHVIANMDHIKLLGVTIDKDINFSKHMGEVCTKAGRKVGVLTRLRNMIPCSAKLNIYNSSILPLLTYYHAVWHLCKASDTSEFKKEHWEPSTGPKMKSSKHFWKEPGYQHWRTGGYRT